MNYPLWDLPAPGLLIAAIAIVHVFVSHFAVGGGLFLVLTEWKARRENDAQLLAWLRRHSRFFILLTLVFGAVTGVGIWFTIGLVHPAATSSLINAFVWGWAIEWTFFFVEIAAAVIYFYGWDRLTAKQHMTVGWVYFVAAWASLFVINGILSFMLTPGDWLRSHAFLDGFLNPTFWSSLVIRTLAAVGLAGIYALFTASWLASPELKQKLVRYAALMWVLPMAIGLPIALFWYFEAAEHAGVPVAEMFGVTAATAPELLRAMVTIPPNGYPPAQRALAIAFGSITFLIVLVFTMFRFRPARFGRVATAVVMVAGLISIGASEWVREDLRKPYVIGSYMFVNGTRMPPPAGSMIEKTRAADDRLRIDRLAEAGVLSSAYFVRLPAVVAVSDTWTIDQEAAAGHEVFRLLCSQCHTIDGYLAIRPLVRGRSSASLEGMMSRLAVAHDQSGRATAWNTPRVRLVTWRHRAMPPFAGTADEKRALAVFLAKLGGGTIEPRTPAVSGSAVFESTCSMCHAPDSDWPMQPRVRGRSEAEMYEMLGALPERNPMMPAFEGTDAERHALAKYLAELGAARR